MSQYSSKWAIFYSNNIVIGETEEDWNNAPNTDVQVVVLFEESPDNRYPYVSPSGLQPRDRQVWTGTDDYTLKDYATVKYGAWMDYDEYMTLFDTALHYRGGE